MVDDLGQLQQAVARSRTAATITVLHDDAGSDNHELPPLLLACRRCSSCSVRLLLETGAAARQLDRHGLGAIHHLCMSVEMSDTKISVLRMLRRAGADVDAVAPGSGLLPLHLAARSADLPFLSHLLLIARTGLLPLHQRPLRAKTRRWQCAPL